MKKFAASFLAIGKTQESNDNNSFSRYIGLGNCHVMAVCPSKEELDKLRGFESQNEPEYTREGDNGKEAIITFVVKTDPQTCNGIETFANLSFILRQAPAYNRDETKVQVIDKYGNSTWANTEDAKAGKVIENRKIDTSYRMACVGEADLVGFLKKYLCVPDAFEYKNGVWAKKANANDYLFQLENVKEYFNGNFKELRDAVALQPNNKIKLLFGVRTNPDDGRQYQAVAARESLILSAHAGANAIDKLEDQLNRLKENGSYPNTEFRVQSIAEYTVEPTDFSNSTPADSTASEGSGMPWD